MKNLLKTTLVICSLFAGLTSSVQQESQIFSELPPDSVMRQELRIAQMQFVPGEVYLRFKDELNISVYNSISKAQIGIASTDVLFIEYGVVAVKKLMSDA
ncbi:MAG: hypothetical protein FD155_3353 [Bacteroidetes bacterium]|nr:MAG: hypothetical protein FD155_3353 [Bacteroidota bacterium]